MKKVGLIRASDSPPLSQLLIYWRLRSLQLSWHFSSYYFALTGLDACRQVLLLPPLGLVVVAAVASSLADYLISKGVDITGV
ncbi:unnamed protein product [Calypogeia fissa]